MTDMTQTIETRLPKDLTEKFDTVLREYAAHYQRALRVFVSRKNKGVSISKSDFLIEFGLTGRQFNAIKREVDGLFKGQKSNYERYILEAHKKNQSRAKRIPQIHSAISDAKAIKDTAQRESKLFKLHKELKACFERTVKANNQIKKWTQLTESGSISACFGSKKLFKAQFELEANQLADHKQWLSLFRSSRDSEFFTLGSKDETGGNQSCTISHGSGGLFNIRVRLPERLAAGANKYVELNNIPFEYRPEKLIQALDNNSVRADLKKGWKSNKGLIERHAKAVQALSERHGVILRRMTERGDNLKGVAKAKQSYSKALEKFSKYTEANALSDFGQALSCRFKRDQKGWRVIISIESQADVELVTNKARGAIGVDLNEHHLAVSEIDHNGNKVQSHDIYFRDRSYGDGSHQVKSGLGLAISQIITKAQEAGKPIVIENLDFKIKKSELKSGRDKQYNKMISSLITAKFLNILKLRCAEKGIELIQVSAAYTSFIGKLKYNNEVGFNVHQAAAIVIARRGVGFRDRKLPKFPFVRVRSELMSFPVPKDTGCGDTFAHFKRVHKAYGEWFENMLSVSAKPKRAVVQPVYCEEIPF